jgi:hypothetical protein
MLLTPSRGSPLRRDVVIVLDVAGSGIEEVEGDGTDSRIGSRPPRANMRGRPSCESNCGGVSFSGPHATPGGPSTMRVAALYDIHANLPG